MYNLFFAGQIHLSKLKIVSFMFCELRNVWTPWQGNRGPQTPEKRQSFLEDLSDLGEEAGGWDIAVDTAGACAERNNFKGLELTVCS